MKQFSRTLIVLLLITGCHHKRTPLTALPEPMTAPPPVAPPPATVSELPPAPPLPQPNAPATPVLSPLGDADDAFTAGNYSEAARRYEKYLQVQANGDRR